MKMIILAFLVLASSMSAFASQSATYDCNIIASSSRMHDSTSLSNVPVLNGATGASLSNLGLDVRLSISKIAGSNSLIAVLYIIDPEARGADSIVGVVSKNINKTDDLFSVYQTIEGVSYGLICVKTN